MVKARRQSRRGAPGRKRDSGSGRAGNGIPSKSTIVSTDTFISPKGRRYTILETDQTDPYDVPADSKKKPPDKA
jgi:hypothetical protein